MIQVMDILPSELCKIVPPLNSQEGVTDPMVYMRFLTDSGWTWYVTEGSQEDDDFIFFGFVIGLEEEWGNFSLYELTEVRDLFGRPVGRDLDFKPERFSQIIAREHRLNGCTEGIN